MQRAKQMTERLGAEIASASSIEPIGRLHTHGIQKKVDSPLDVMPSPLWLSTYWGVVVFLAILQVPAWVAIVEAFRVMVLCVLIAWVLDQPPRWPWPANGEDDHGD